MRQHLAGDAQFGIRAHVESKDLDWEAGRRTNISAWTDYETYQFQWQQSFNWDYNEDDLYVLEMRHGDRPKATTASAICKSAIPLLTALWSTAILQDYVRLSFADIFWRRYLPCRKTPPQQHRFDKSSQSGFGRPDSPHLTLNSRAMYHYSLKDFSYLGNTATLSGDLSQRLGLGISALRFLFGTVFH